MVLSIKKVKNSPGLRRSCYLVGYSFVFVLGGCIDSNRPFLFPSQDLSPDIKSGEYNICNGKRPCAHYSNIAKGPSGDIVVFDNGSKEYTNYAVAHKIEKGVYILQVRNFGFSRIIKSPSYVYGLLLKDEGVDSFSTIIPHCDFGKTLVQTWASKSGFYLPHTYNVCSFDALTKEQLIDLVVTLVNEKGGRRKYSDQTYTLVKE